MQLNIGLHVLFYSDIWPSLKPFFFSSLGLTFTYYGLAYFLLDTFFYPSTVVNFFSPTLFIC